MNELHSHHSVVPEGPNEIAPTFLWRAPRVLLIEDDDLLRALLRTPLLRAGYDVDTVASVPEALEHLRQATDPESSVLPPDIIVTDVYLTSTKTGLDLAEDLRGVGWTTPVVVMTSYGSPAIAARACSQRDCAYIEKPFEPTALEHTLRRLLSAG